MNNSVFFTQDMTKDEKAQILINMGFSDEQIQHEIFMWDTMCGIYGVTDNGVFSRLRAMVMGKGTPAHCLATYVCECGKSHVIDMMFCADGLTCDCGAVAVVEILYSNAVPMMDAKFYADKLSTIEWAD